MKLQITNVAAGRVPVNATVQGKHYAVQIAKGQRLSLADVQAAGKAHGEGVVATREGTTLKLKYADGTTVSIENFYSVCANGECAVQLDGLAADPVSIAADTAAGTSDVVYAYGTPAQLHDILGEAAQSVLSQATPVADGVVEFLPTASSHFSPLGMLGLGALGVAGIVGIAAASGGSGGGDDGKSGSDDGNASGSGPTTPTKPPFGAPKLALKHDAGGSASDGISNDGHIKVTGVNPGNDWEYTTDGGKTWTKGTNDEFVLPEGDFPPGAIQVRQINGAGDKSPVGQSPIAIVIDKTPPTTDFDAPSVKLKHDAGTSGSDGRSNDGTMLVDGVTPGNGWEYTTDNGKTWTKGTGDTFDLPEGDHPPGTVQVRQVDLAGNTSPVGKTTTEIVIDKTPPSDFDAPGVKLKHDAGTSGSDGTSND
ncbi:MAG: hypothetical protein REJ50_25095, partial [Bordetella sp.]|nr:hypothetical protein [Bordetella sp.]